MLNYKQVELKREKMNEISYVVVFPSIFSKNKIPQLIKDLQQFYEVLYNADLSLFTLRHYNDSSFDSFLQDKDVILEQKSRNTIQFIAR